MSNIIQVEKCGFYIRDIYTSLFFITISFSYYGILFIFGNVDVFSLHFEVSLIFLQCKICLKKHVVK